MTLRKTYGIENTHTPRTHYERGPRHDDNTFDENTFAVPERGVRQDGHLRALNGRDPMVTPQRQTASTRDRLLFSACRIFASKGYRDTTVADICEAAQANIASVNYHFGNKESLYRQVFQRQIDLYEPPESPALNGSQDGEEVLKAFIVDRLEWLVQDDPLERLIRAEIVQPTGLVDDLRVAGLEKSQTHFLEAVRLLSGDTLSEATIRLCVTSILSQCRALMALSQLGFYASATTRPTDEEIKSFADHVTVFSVAGIKALAAREDSGPTGFTPSQAKPQSSEALPQHS